MKRCSRRLAEREGRRGRGGGGEGEGVEPPVGGCSRSKQNTMSTRLRRKLEKG